MLLCIYNLKSINAAYIEAIDLCAIAFATNVHSPVEFLADLLTHRHDKVHAIVIVLPIIFRILNIKIALRKYH